MKTLLAFTTTLLLLFFCSYLPGGTKEALALDQPTVTITVNPDGTFTPSVVNVEAGQTIQWVNLSITDSITITYTDLAGLPRRVPIAIRVPITAPVPLPAVIWSHGGAGGHTNPARSMVEWSETTAEAGYLTISIAHLPRMFTPTDTRTPLCHAIALQSGGRWDLDDPATCHQFNT